MVNIINNNKQVKQHRKKSEDYLKDFVPDKNIKGIGKNVPKKKKGTKNEDGMIGYF